ncbi:YpuI family protein [Evansella tamaricis]|uniref:YpuI family protein n=1 Tax=Evansella tamaricis TaxID=2069301 RepID=A0ABS6JM75_9BACI|nr:YpuI family protein [Evansella tamaricis]MBU9714781.1 YpuI family protein [Evansella tamaricis]
MGNDLVQQQLTFTMVKLEKASTEIRKFLNETTLQDLMSQGDQKSKGDYVDILDQFRRILVYFDEGQESGNLLLRSEAFRKGAAEKTLYWIFHQCVEEFFQPKLDVWYEDSRAAYTGRNAIKFRVTVPEDLKDLVKSIEGPLQEVREELEYYETDYRTKVRQRDND